MRVVSLLALAFAAKAQQYVEQSKDGTCPRPYSVVPHQHTLGPKGPHVDENGVLKITSGAAKAVGTDAVADGADELHKTKGVPEGAVSWLETARNAATRYLGGSDRVKDALKLAEERSPGDVGGVDKAKEGDAIDAAAPGELDADRRRLATLKATYHYGDGRTKEVRACKNCEETCKYTYKNGCPAGFNIWVPESKAEAEWGRGFGPNYAGLVGVFKTTNDCKGSGYDLCGGKMEMNSGWSDPLLAANPSLYGRYWMSVSRTPYENQNGGGRPWFIRTNPRPTDGEPSGDYYAGSWLEWNHPYGKPSSFEAAWDSERGFNFNDDVDPNKYCKRSYLCEQCPAGRFKPAGSAGADGYYCKLCAAGKYSGAGQGTCTDCEVGKYASGSETPDECTSCDAGKSTTYLSRAVRDTDLPTAGRRATSISQCVTCDPGWVSDVGSACTPCDPGKESNSDNTDCVLCDAGYISSAGSMCTPCAAGKTSNLDNTACEDCAEGKYSRLPACVMEIAGPVAASRNSLPAVDTVDSLQNYELTFTMELADDWTHGGWQSILHIGNTDSQRMPGIWFHESLNALHVMQSYADCHVCEWGVTTTGVTFAKNETYDVRVVVDSNQMAVYVDGVVVGTESGSATYTTSAAVYVGDPWYDAAKVKISDVCLRPGDGPVCEPCEAGRFSTGGQADACTKCGDGGSAWKLENWDQSQSDLTSKDECLCKRGLTGTNCDQAECSPTTPLVSLGFLVLEVQWPQFARTLSKNEDFVGISGAFRSFDTNSDDRLSVEEARRAVRDGGMAVPLEVTHIWSRGDKKLYTNDLTITDMIDDELKELQVQQSVEYYNRPPGSGAITKMTATYPNPRTTNHECAAQNELKPLVNWTIDRGDKTIFQQCVYFDGVALSQDEGLTPAISDGGGCNDDPSQCSYEFQLPENYTVVSYPSSSGILWPAVKTIDVGAGPQDLGEVWTSVNYELYFRIDVDALESFGVFKSIIRVRSNSSDAINFDNERYPAVWFNAEGKLAFRQTSVESTGILGQYKLDSKKTFAAGQSYDVRITSANSKLSLYVDGALDAETDAPAPYVPPEGVGRLIVGSDGGVGHLPAKATISGAYYVDPPGTTLDISKHSYCVETKFCAAGVECTNTSTATNLTVKRCTTGLQYDGTPMDVYARMLGTQGVALSWLDTSTVATGYRVYKVADITVPFAADTSARLLREVVMRAPDCGLTHAYLSFRDITTGSKPGLYVGYAVVPLNDEGAEDKEKVGKNSFIVTWFGDVYVEVAAEGGGPVKDVLVKLSHVVDGEIDEKYRDFVEVLTDEYGEAHLEVRVQDPKWTGLTQHFRVTVEKNSTRLDKPDLVHEFEPSFQDVTVRHLGQGTFEFTDTTSRVISGTVSHDGFGAAYFAANCPHTKSEDSSECICPVDGAEMYVKRASGGKEEVTLNQGKFATAVFEGETVTLGLRMYNGTNGDVPHIFSVTHDACGCALSLPGPIVASESNKVATVDTLENYELTFTMELASDWSITGEWQSIFHIGDTDKHRLPGIWFRDTKNEICVWQGEQSVTSLAALCSKPDLFFEATKTYVVRVVYESNQMTLYVDGVSVGIGTSSGGIGATAADAAVYVGDPWWPAAKVTLSNICLQPFGTSCDAATVQEGTEPTFTYTATDDAELHFLDISTQTLSATYVVGDDRAAAEYVNGLPVVAKVERCGWEQPVWALRGVATFELGAAAVEVRALGDNEVLEPKYYGPPDKAPGSNDLVCESNAARDKYVDGDGDDSTMIRGCRAKIPEVRNCDEGKGETPAVHKCQNERLPCATSNYKYVDQQPKNRKVEVDLTILATNATNATASPVEFEIVSPLCLASVSAAAASGTTLQYLVDSKKESRNADGYPLATTEELLLSKDLPKPKEDGLYGKACTDDTNAVFRKGDAVDYGFKLVDREPECYGIGIWPWDKGVACSGYTDTPPSPNHTIAIRVADGVSGIDGSATYGDEPFKHVMKPDDPNAFAPFSKEMTVEFARQFDGGKILFVRHAMIVGSIPEEVPQVWTVATNPTLIFLILRDPPGGGSFTSLTEGSTISTSMAIEGAQAAELADSWEVGGAVGGGAQVKGGACMGAVVLKNVVEVGADASISYSTTPTDVTVERASSRHFDIGISFEAGISTSDSPYIAGQPSDVIVGGGANLRFISSIDVYATKTPGNPAELCLRGRTTLQFLPEQITTYVMSVYEIEKTIERLGGALRDPNVTKLENANKSSTYDPSADLEKQIENWRTVLANYRDATLKDQAESVANYLEDQLSNTTATFQTFLADAVLTGNTEFSDFLANGLNKLDDGVLGTFGGSEDLPKDVENKAGGERDANMKAEEDVDRRSQLADYDAHALDRVNKAFTDCVASVELTEPGNKKAQLCDVYRNISKKIELKSSLFGVCKFQEGNPAVTAFCKQDAYRPGKDVIGAFGALSDTTQFITFSGTTGLEFSWDMGEARGAELISTHDAASEAAVGAGVQFGANFGRRLESTDDKDDRGVPGYAYPISGRVLAKSKKLLEVTHEMLEERRRLEATLGGAAVAAAKKGATPEDAEETPGAPCMRRLGDAELSDDERRRLGVTVCAGFDGSLSRSFAVSLGRAAGREAEHTRSVSVSFVDPNLQDVFAVKISQDTVYGTPIFTTMGGRSSCVGETGTTKRDSRVVIKEIRPLCATDKVCDGKLTCECKNLKPGQDAYFSVVLENLSPWVSSVKSLFRAVNGAATHWNSAKYASKLDTECPEGDPGSLAISTIGSPNFDIRDGDGIILSPLNYGQSEVHIKVTRASFVPLSQCYSYSNIELELVSVCEDTDWGDVQEVYQYRTTMDAKTGAVSVVHPNWNSSTYSWENQSAPHNEKPFPSSAALGPATSKASFSVSWKNEIRGCMYDTAVNYNPAATVPDLSCIFEIKGCPFAAAANYNKKATVDDGSCVFEPATVSGGLCLSGVNASEPQKTITKLKNRIHKLTGVPTSNIKIVESTGGCTRRLQESLLSGRILQATSFRYVYEITTEAKHIGSVQGVLSTDLQTALEDDDLTVESADLPQLDDSCEECTSDDQCEPGSFCEFGSGGGTRKLRFGNIQSGCCRAL